MKKNANLEVKYFTLTAFLKFIFLYISSSRENTELPWSLKVLKITSLRTAKENFPGF